MNSEIARKKNTKHFRDFFDNDHDDDKNKNDLSDNINELRFEKSDVQMNIKLFISFNVLNINQQNSIYFIDFTFQ